MAFVHFKCKFDPAWDYPAIGKELFGGNKALIVAKKLTTISHVLFQGHTDFDQKQILEKTVTLGKTHFLCKEIPAPIRHVNRKVEDVEFRFMCKEDREPLYALGFKEGELAMLRAYAARHMDETRGLRDLLHAQRSSFMPGATLEYYRNLAAEYYIQEDKRPGPQFQRDVTWIMYTNPLAQPQENPLWYA